MQLELGERAAEARLEGLKLAVDPASTTLLSRKPAGACVE